MEIKREIVESRLEVSKDNLWLKPEDNKKKLLYYGIKGWTELIGSGSGTCEPGDNPSNPDDKIDLSKLTNDELLKFQKELEKVKKNLPPEEYIKFLVTPYSSLQELYKNNQNIYNYIYNNLSGKWSYEYDGQKYDTPEIVKVLDKGVRLQFNLVNPDLYIEVINDNGINYSMLQLLLQLKNSEYLWECLYVDENLFSEFYELQNGKVVKIKNVRLSDYIKIVDKSVESGSKEVTDGFRPRIKADTLIIDDHIDKILEYYRYRSMNNIIQDYGKYIIVWERDKNSNWICNKYQVVSTAGFTLTDYYIVFGRNSDNEDSKIHKENILKLIGSTDIKFLSDYCEREYLQEGGAKDTWSIKKGNKFYLSSQPHIEFTVLADDIKKEDLEKIKDLDNYLVYSNQANLYEYTYVEKYYLPYEDYKNPQDLEQYRIYEDQIKKTQKIKKEAEKSKFELVSLLEKLKDKIQYNGEIITTIRNY